MDVATHSFQTGIGHDPALNKNHDGMSHFLGASRIPIAENGRILQDQLAVCRRWQAELLPMDDLHAAFALYIEKVVEENEHRLAQRALHSEPARPEIKMPLASQRHFAHTTTVTALPPTAATIASVVNKTSSAGASHDTEALHAEQHPPEPTTQVQHGLQTPVTPVWQSCPTTEGMPSTLPAMGASSIAEPPKQAPTGMTQGVATQSPPVSQATSPFAAASASASASAVPRAASSASLSSNASSTSPLTVMKEAMKEHTGMLDLPTRFHSKQAPNISIAEYISRIARYACIDRCLLLILMVYVERVRLYHPEFVLTSLTVHRFLIAAVTCCAKTCFDSYCSNTHYAKVGGIARRELNVLELEFLFLIRFDLLVIDTTDLQACHQKLTALRPPQAVSTST